MTLAVLNSTAGRSCLACLASIGAAVIVGLVNILFVIVYFDNDPFIVTLGTEISDKTAPHLHRLRLSNSVGIVSTSLSNSVCHEQLLAVDPLAVLLRPGDLSWLSVTCSASSPTRPGALVIGRSPRGRPGSSGVRSDHHIRACGLLLGADWYPASRGHRLSQHQRHGQPDSGQRAPDPPGLRRGLPRRQPQSNQAPGWTPLGARHRDVLPGHGHGRT